MHNIYIHVYLCSLILILQSCGDKGIGIYYSIYKVGTSLNHSLVYKLAEWLRLHNIAKVVKELVPESGIYKVACCMLCTANVEIHISPVLICLPAHKSALVGRVHIP